MISTSGWKFSVRGYDEEGYMVYEKRICTNSGLYSCVNWAFRKGAIKVIVEVIAD